MDNFQFLLITLVLISVTCQSPFDDDTQLLRQLKLLKDQNKRLERQNRQLSVIMDGLQRMCSAFNLQSNECKGDSNPADDEGDTPERIVLHKLSSSGLKDDSVNITATFSVPNDFNIFWWIRSINNELVRTGGTNEILEDAKRHVSTVKIRSRNETSFVWLTIETESELKSIVFNLEALEAGGDQEITIEPITHPFNKSYIAHSEEDMEFNITLNEDPREVGVETIEAYFSGLNTSSEPYTFYEVSSFSLYRAIDIKGTPTEDWTKSLITITLHNEYARMGGILTIRFQVDRDTGFYEQFLHGQKLLILNPDSHEVIQPDSIGIYPTEKQMYIIKEQSLVCGASGNPAPTVHLARMHRNTEILVPPDTTFRDKYTHIVSAKLSAHEKDVKGTYICRASNGNKIAETQTEVAVFEAMVFNDKKTGATVIADEKTGAMENTKTEVFVSCIATGVPRPILELRLYTAYGPDIIKSGLYKVVQSESGSSERSVLVTLSPEDDRDIFTVYCVAIQPDVHFASIQRKIRIFPEREENWELKEKISNVIYNLENEPVDSEFT